MCSLYKISSAIYEPHLEIIFFLQMRKQRRRSAAQKTFFWGYIDSAILRLLKSKITNLLSVYVAVQPTLCRTQSDLLNRIFHDSAQIMVKFIWTVRIIIGTSATRTYYHLIFDC